MTKRRVPRKSKKWHKKRGWTICFFSTSGKIYFVRDYQPFQVTSR